MKSSYSKNFIFFYCLLITLVIYFSNLPVLSQAQSIANEQEVPQVLYYGMRDDSRPVSYIGFTKWRGYCVDLQEDLQKYINNRKKNYKVEFHEKQVSFENRYKGKSNDKTLLDVECGPNTISKKSRNTIKQYKGEFSNPFAWTGAKVLLKKENKKLFYSSEPFKGQILGVYGKTRNISTTDSKGEENNINTFKERESTTSDFVEKIYTSSQIVDVDRGYAFKELKNDNIKGYITDEIILWGLLEDAKELLNQENKIISEQYSILPYFSKLSYEPYGIVVYHCRDISSQILNDINDYLETSKAKKIFKKHNLDNYQNIWLDGVEEIYYYNFNLWIGIIFVSIFSFVLIILLIIKIILAALKTIRTQKKYDINNRSNSPKTKAISDFLQTLGFSRRIIQIIVNIIQSGTISETYNNDNRGANIGNIAGKNQDQASQQANQDNTDASSSERDDTLS